VLYLIPLLPFVGFLLNTTVTRRASKGISGGIATGAMALSFGVSVAMVSALLRAEPVGGVRSIHEVVYTWMSSDRLNVPIAFYLDPLSAVMILVVTGIGTLIHLYSTAYMHDATFRI
jgi:NADH-quinone oxidoreductase subunit L